MLPNYDGFCELRYGVKRLVACIKYNVDNTLSSNHLSAHALVYEHMLCLLRCCTEKLKFSSSRGEVPYVRAALSLESFMWAIGWPIHLISDRWFLKMRRFHLDQHFDQNISSALISILFICYVFFDGMPSGFCRIRSGQGNYLYGVSPR